ncbi:glycosyl transferase family protein [Paremcibacter congregatus]|uniref:glycosyl transferase family protein n=1 Tax=Paremcibacter congregatus TaxID=2043170 RepID=UPI0030ED9E14|tara:strand:+ start:2199 stop:3185 length:987 start_codon:yes stop_codon:yes gene_type:complete
MTNSYAEIIRTLGRGPTNSRHLTIEEAEYAFRGVMSGEMSDLQVGALLLLLRYRSESPAELAGIVAAIRAQIGGDTKAAWQDIIDWPSYSSGKSRRLPWFLLSAKLLADNGYKIFMHGFNSHLENGLLTEECLPAIGEAPLTSVDAAKKHLAAHNFAYLPLRCFAPKLQELLEIRSVLGVRSIVNTAVKLVNPLQAQLIFLGIFHPAYITLNMEAAALLGQPGLGVIKGGGGEAERNIQKPIKLFKISGDQETTSQWPALLPGKDKPDYPVTVEYLTRIWQGATRNDYASAMITGTAAQALFLSGAASTVEAAEDLAQTYWATHLQQL